MGGGEFRGRERERERERENIEGESRVAPFPGSVAIGASRLEESRDF